MYIINEKDKKLYDKLSLNEKAVIINDIKEQMNKLKIRYAEKLLLLDYLTR